jgi:hypothetical protein
MMSFTCGIAAGLQIDDPVFIPPLETGLETIGGLQYTGEVDGGGGDLDFFGVGGFGFPSCAFCC